MEVLQRAGLADRVRLGAPLPRIAGAPASPGSTRNDTTTNRAEEALFPPDDLLRPLARPTEGRLVEIAGAISSGRTALAQRLAAGTTARGELVGWVDVSHALDPRSLLRAGVDLGSVLWVRPPGVRAALHSTELLVKTGFGLVTLDLADASPRELGSLGPSVWNRLLRSVRSARSTVLVLAPQRLTGASATLGLELERGRASFEGGLLEGLDARLHVTRRRDAPPGADTAFQLHHRPA